MSDMKGKYYHYIAILVFSLIALFFVFGIKHIGWLLYQVHENPSTDFMNKIGTFGDSAGLLNALFSSLAFGGVLLTIFWQITENRKQRADEHRIQFENVFFNMTNTLEKIVAELKVKREEDNVEFSGDDSSWDDDEAWGEEESAKDKELYVQGREVFKYLYEEKKPSIPDVVKNRGIYGFEERMTGVFDSYFRYLYRILKYIDSSKLISDDVKYQYAGILRAHLSYMELPFIYYNGLSSFGRKNMKPLIERYHLLKNIRKEKLHDQQLNAPIEELTVNEMYDESAWNKEIKKELKINSMKDFCWKMVFAVLFAFIFNTLVADWWYEHVVGLWEGMNEIVVRGIALIAITISLLFYRYRRVKYRELFTGIKIDKSVAWHSMNILKGNYTLPIFVFLLTTSLYVNLSNHLVWFHSHTIYLDLAFFYCPLMADVIAMIRSLVEMNDNIENPQR